MGVLYFLSIPVKAQVFLQVEELNKVETTKFYPGQKFGYKLKAYDDSWEKGRITNIDPEANIIYINGVFFQLDEFKAIRHAGDPRGRAMGILFSTFGYAWSGYGLIAYFTGGQVTVFDAVIGAVSICAGWVFSKFFKYKSYQLGNGNRLRIVDARMIVPD